MQLQTPADTEEKKVSTLMLGASRVFFVFVFVFRPTVSQSGHNSKQRAALSFKGCFYLARCRLHGDCQSGPTESHRAVHSSSLEFNPAKRFVAGN